MILLTIPKLPDHWIARLSSSTANPAILPLNLSRRQRAILSPLERLMRTTDTPPSSDITSMITLTMFAPGRHLMLIRITAAGPLNTDIEVCHFFPIYSLGGAEYYSDQASGMRSAMYSIFPAISIITKAKIKTDLIPLRQRCDFRLLSRRRSLT